MKIKNDKLFEELKAILKEYDINLEEHEEVQVHKENTNQPYTDGIKLEILSEYNKNYTGNRTCMCGHGYDRHFDSWEDNAPIGCKYCRCYDFKPITEGLLYTYKIKEKEDKEGSEVYLTISKDGKEEKEIKFITYNSVDYEVDVVFDDILNVTLEEKELEVEIESATTEKNKEHFEEIKEYFKKHNAKIKEV